MINILLSGCNGRMGNAVVNSCLNNPDCTVIGGIDVMGGSNKYDFPVFSSTDDFMGKCDVIIDFSHHTATEGLLYYACEKKLPVVIATTGHTAEEISSIKKASEIVPVFYSRNMLSLIYLQEYM